MIAFTSRTGPIIIGMLFLIYTVSCNADGSRFSTFDLETWRGLPCVQTHVQQLYHDPWSFDGKLVCVIGQLRPMIPLGEERAQLRDMNGGPESWNALLTLSLRLDPATQEELSRLSGTKLYAVGKFEFNPNCWGADHSLNNPNRECFPPHQMWLSDPRIFIEEQP